MPYVLQRQLTGDGALIDQTSHWDTSFNAGETFQADFQTPVTFSIDTESDGRAMPTLFAVPTLVARKAFVEVLRRAGVDNVDAYPATIVNPETNERFDDYFVLNVIGVAAAADLGKSEHFQLGPGLRVIDRIVLDAARIPDVYVFRLAEDPLQIIVSDRLANVIAAAGFADVYLEPLEVSR